MRLTSRVLSFMLAVVFAFWFTAQNATQVVRVDLGFLRVRASLPIVVFGAIVLGMALSFLWSWRADRAT